MSQAIHQLLSEKGHINLENISIESMAVQDKLIKYSHR